MAITVNDEDGSYGPTLITKHRVRLPTRVGGPLADHARILGALRSPELGQHCALVTGASFGAAKSWP